MLKSMRVAPELLALSQMQRAATREVGAPLYLPAFETHILKADASEDDNDLDMGDEAGGFSIGNDEDDDFY